MTIPPADAPGPCTCDTRLVYGDGWQALCTVIDKRDPKCPTHGDHTITPSACNHRRPGQWGPLCDLPPNHDGMQHQHTDGDITHHWGNPLTDDLPTRTARAEPRTPPTLGALLILAIRSTLLEWSVRWHAARLGHHEARLAAHRRTADQLRTHL